MLYNKSIYFYIFLCTNKIYMNKKCLKTGKLKTKSKEGQDKNALKHIKTTKQKTNII